MKILITVAVIGLMIFSNIIAIPSQGKVSLLNSGCELIDISKSFCLSSKVLLSCSVLLFLGAKSLGSRYDVFKTLKHVEEVKLEEFNYNKQKEYEKLKVDPFTYLLENQQDLDFYFELDQSVSSLIADEIGNFYTYIYALITTSIFLPITIIIYYHL